MDALKLAKLLSSSSSSDDEEVFSVIALVFNSVTKRIKVDNFGATISSYTNEEFRKHFRVSRTTLDFLAKRYAKFNPQNLNHGGVPQPDNIVHILSFLWFAGNKSTIREVANLFNTSESSCHKYIYKVMDFFIQLAPSVIKFPRSTQEKEVASREFERISGIPDIIGCIDGLYIPCRTPAHKIRSTYINRHDMVSITLQGICDSRRRFLDVFCGPRSKIPDSQIFHLSFISKCLPCICGTKYHLLADSAYPLREWLITPYKESPNLDETHREFIKPFCATRVI